MSFSTHDGQLAVILDGLIVFATEEVRGVMDGNYAGDLFDANWERSIHRKGLWVWEGHVDLVGPGWAGSEPVEPDARLGGEFRRGTMLDWIEAFPAPPTEELAEELRSAVDAAVDAMRAGDDEDEKLQELADAVMRRAVSDASLRLSVFGDPAPRHQAALRAFRAHCGDGELHTPEWYQSMFAIWMAAWKAAGEVPEQIREGPASEKGGSRQRHWCALERDTIDGPVRTCRCYRMLERSVRRNELDWLVLHWDEHVVGHGQTVGQFLMEKTGQGRGTNEVVFQLRGVIGP